MIIFFFGCYILATFSCVCQLVCANENHVHVLKDENDFIFRHKEAEIIGFHWKTCLKSILPKIFSIELHSVLILARGKSHHSLTIIYMPAEMQK